MKRKLSVVALMFAVALAAVFAISERAEARGRGDGPIIYVISQGLYYDSIITADPLPPFGPFQQLRMDGPPPLGLQTEYGPGDSGYRGGRWWVDVNGNGMMDLDDRYFSCPLLGPGRAEP